MFKKIWSGTWQPSFAHLGANVFILTCRSWLTPKSEPACSLLFRFILPEWCDLNDFSYSPNVHALTSLEFRKQRRITPPKGSTPPKGNISPYQLECWRPFKKCRYNILCAWELWCNFPSRNFLGWIHCAIDKISKWIYDLYITCVQKFFVRSFSWRYCNYDKGKQGWCKKKQE